MAESRQTSLYQYFDRYGILIYVGITARGQVRNHEHNAHKSWWPFVDHQRVTHFASRPEATVAEKQLIEQRRPPFNIQHNPDRGELAETYTRYAKAAAASPEPGKSMHDLKGRLPLVDGQFDTVDEHPDCPLIASPSAARKCHRCRTPAVPSSWWPHGYLRVVPRWLRSRCAVTAVRWLRALGRLPRCGAQIVLAIKFDAP